MRSLLLLWKAGVSEAMATVAVACVAMVCMEMVSKVMVTVAMVTVAMACMAMVRMDGQRGDGPRVGPQPWRGCWERDGVAACVEAWSVLCQRRGGPAQDP